MERHFEQELEKLNKRIIKMGNLVASQIHETMQALIQCDVDKAREIIKNDTRVDKLDNKIDKLCQRIFALTQPMATDLRLIMSSLKINNDLERMGDIAVNIAGKIDGLTELQEIIPELEIDKLANMTDNIVFDIINILSTRKVELVNNIFNDSTAIKDKIEIISASILEEMTKKTDVIVVATNLIVILTQIERIAAYSTNIAEAIVFLVEGKVVKHSHNKKENKYGDD